MKRKRGQSEMADTKYLFKRGGVWAIRFRLPDRFAREKVFQRSLSTGDITAARKFRDLHVMPFLAGEDLYTATSALVDKAIRLRIAQDQRFGKLKGLLLPGSEPDAGALSLRALAGVLFTSHAFASERTTSFAPPYRVCASNPRLSFPNLLGLSQFPDLSTVSNA